MYIYIYVHCTEEIHYQTLKLFYLKAMLQTIHHHHVLLTLNAYKRVNMEIVLSRRVFHFRKY